ncbi:MAG: zinc ABC transporter substrate-binding protein [Candidatus Bathyarchaeia archaeon]
MLRRETMIFAAIIMVLLPLASVELDVSIVSASVVQNNDPIRVVVSVEMLKAIVSPIIDGVGEVYPIISGGVEPHSFTLTPSIIHDVCRSDLIVVTGHMEWENKLVEEAAKVRGVNADLISINLLELDGIKILSLDGGRNVHGFWLLPDNAIIIAREVKDRILKMRPDLSQRVTENYVKFERRVLDLKNFLEGLSDRYNVCGKSVVIGFYAEMYIVEALGLKVGSWLMGEEEMISPEKLKSVYDGLRSGEYTCIIFSDVAALRENTKRILEEVSEKTGCPVAYVLTVSSDGLDDYNAVMYYNAGQIYCALLTSHPPAQSSPDIYLFTIMALLVIIAFETSLLIRRGSSK